MLTPSERTAKIKAVIRVASGNFLEMYDFMVFGYYAAAIGKTFFPKNSEFASLMLSLATFGVGFLMRPLGALVLGAYIDRHGRRSGLDSHPRTDVRSAQFRSPACRDMSRSASWHRCWLCLADCCKVFLLASS